MIRSIVATCALAAMVSACGARTTEHADGFKPVSVSYQANLQSYRILSDPDVKGLRAQRKPTRTLWIGIPREPSVGSRHATVHEMEAFARTHPEALKGAGRVCARGTPIPMRLDQYGKPAYYAYPIVRVDSAGRAHFGTTRDLLCQISLQVER